MPLGVGMMSCSSVVSSGDAGFLPGQSLTARFNVRATAVPPCHCLRPMTAPDLVLWFRYTGPLPLPLRRGGVPRPLGGIHMTPSIVPGKEKTLKI